MMVFSPPVPSPPPPLPSLKNETNEGTTVKWLNQWFTLLFNVAIETGKKARECERWIERYSESLNGFNRIYIQSQECVLFNVWIVFVGIIYLSIFNWAKESKKSKKRKSREEKQKKHFQLQLEVGTRSKIVIWIWILLLLCFVFIFLWFRNKQKLISVAMESVDRYMGDLKSDFDDTTKVHVLFFEIFIIIGHHHHHVLFIWINSIEWSFRADLYEK